MSEKYLLPCTCGQNVVVEQRQAGTTVRCMCGKSLEVPTIRGLEALAHADEVEKDLPPLWGIRQGLIFLGLVIALPAFAFAIFVYTRLPTLNETNVEQAIMALSPTQSWLLWKAYADGMPKTPAIESVAVIRGIQVLRRWIMLGLIVGVIGLLVSAGGFLVKPTKR
jgi:hypothetical protein